MRKNLVAAICGAVFTSTVVAYAAPNGEFDYPELLVTPRASDRLASEAAKEPSSRLTSHLPLQISALTTLTAGIIQVAGPDKAKDPDGVSGFGGIAVGGLWLLTSIGLEAFYQPYSNASAEVAAMPAKTPREQLTRERYAEEVFRTKARLASRLKWLSLLTNLGANGYMIAKAGTGTVQQVADGVALAFAFAPLVFRHHWEDVHSEQESYKKRIYAPIASATVFNEPGTSNIAPGLALAISF